MKKDLNETPDEQKIQEVKKASKKGTKVVVNRGLSKVELMVDGKVIPIIAGQSVEIPDYVPIPYGVGLTIRLNN